MQAGKLHHRVVIETPTNTVTAMGDTQESWSTHAPVWASVHEIQGTETVVADKVESHLTHKVLIRHLSTVTTKMRVNDSDKSRILYIKYITADPKDKRYMYLHCQEVL